MKATSPGPPPNGAISATTVICDVNGVTSFDHIRYRRNDGDVFLYAFDLIELNGDDLRRDPIDVRKNPLYRAQSQIGPLYHLLPLYRQLTLM
jgi:ATP-dependent DNA ligase